MSFTHWLLLASVCALGAMSPGPSLALILHHAAYSRRSGLISALTHGIGIGFYAALAISGLALALQQWPWIIPALHGLAGAFLLWLAWHLWRAPARWQAQGAAVGHATCAAARDGFLMAFFNPKVAVVFLAIFAPIVPAQASAVERAGIALMAALIDGLWYALVTLSLRRQWLLIRLHAHAFVVNRVGAVVFALLAVKLWSGQLPAV
jgi:threonine/homoserine/homoserine lactone efflux protein